MGSNLLGSGAEKCPCGKIFDFASEKDWEMKFHHKFCSDTVGSKQVMIPKKAITLREQQLDDAERKRKVHKNH